MKNKIKITIEGPVGSGKSRILYLLKNFLIANRFKVEHDCGIDFKDVHDFDKHMIKDFADVIATIKENSDITIEEKQSPRVIEKMTITSYDLMSDGSVQPNGYIKE